MTLSFFKKSKRDVKIILLYNKKLLFFSEGSANLIALLSCGGKN